MSEIQVILDVNILYLTTDCYHFFLISAFV